MRSLFLLCFLAAISAATAADDALNDDKVQGQIGQLRGQVIIENHPEMGRAPATGAYLVFQRRDCKRCAIGVRCDIEGKYELFLTAGEYRVISTGSQLEGEGPDLVSPRQAHYVRVQLPPNVTTFDVVLRLPASWVRRR
jgi:hypothetical protein